MPKFDVQTNSNNSSKRLGIFSSDYCKHIGDTCNNMENGPYGVDVPSFPRKIQVASLNNEPPKDKWQALRIILAIQGLATSLPWNMFINAQPYFQDYKLMINPNSTDMERHYQSSFMNYITICSMIPSVLFAAINVFITNSSVVSPMRMIVAKLVMLALLAVTIALAAIDTRDYVVTFFIVTMVIIVFINGAAAIFQNSLVGICSILPSKFITTLFFGTNIAGVLTSISSIISIAISSNAKISSLFYFSSAIFIVMIALITNKIFQRLPLYLYYKNQVLNKFHQTDEQSSRPQFWKIFKKIWMTCFNLWLTLTITVFNFPNVVSHVKRMSIPINDIYWIPVFCFLNFNIFILLGTVLVFWTVWPGPKRMWIVVLIRTLIFGPFFILGNYLPDERVMPKYLANDYVYIVAIMVLALTGTYLVNACFVSMISLLEENELAVGGMILNLFVFLAVLSGGLVSFITRPLVQCC